MKPTLTAALLLADGTVVEEIMSEGRPQLLCQRPHSEPEIGDTVEVAGYVLAPHDDQLIGSGAVKLAGPPQPYGSEQRLADELRGFVHAYVQLTEAAEQMATWYALHSWTADQLSVTPYFRLLDDYGRGKTRGLETIGSICRLPMFAAGATTASPIFRMLERYRGGTFIMDEADHRDTDLWADITKILNQGYMKGWPVLRSEKVGGRYEPMAYDCFGPKLLATRARFDDDALESRCITYQMPSLDRRDLPLILPPTFEEEAMALRSKLLSYRLDKVREVRAWVPAVFHLNGLDPRLSQIIAPLKRTITDKAACQELDRFAREYQQELVVNRGLGIEARVLRAIIGLHNAGKVLRMGSIAEEANREEGAEPLSAKVVGQVVRDSLHLPVHKAKGRYEASWDQQKIDALIGHYGLADDDEEGANDELGFWNEDGERG
jgi:hypothetical protein